MRAVFISFLLFLATALPVMAQDGEPRALGPVTDQPVCSRIVNDAPYLVFGEVATQQFIRPDGIKTRHRSTFRLESGSFNEFCTTGPFYEGRTVDFVIRTLIPIFSCRTGVGGDIVIHGRLKPEGGAETWADCLPAMAPDPDDVL